MKVQELRDREDVDLGTDEKWEAHADAGLAPVSTRTMQFIAAGNRSVKRSTLDALASFFGVQPQTLVLAQFVRWDEKPDLNDDDLASTWKDEVNQAIRQLKRATHDDMKGDHSAACKLGMQAKKQLQPLVDEVPEVYGEMLVRLATFHEHDNLLDASAELIAEATSVASTFELPETHAWARYQQGILHRRNEQFSNALSEFNDLLLISGPRDREASIQHQMGVVELMQFRKTGDRRHLTLSKEYFLKARALWDKVNTYVTNATTHRAAFTLRRLGEVASEFGNQRESVKHLLKALRVFEKHGCIRYANEVEAAVIDQL